MNYCRNYNIYHRDKKNIVSGDIRHLYKDYTAIVEQLVANIREEFSVISSHFHGNTFYISEFYLANRDLPKMQPVVAQIDWIYNFVFLQRCNEPEHRWSGAPGVRETNGKRKREIFGLRRNTLS